MTKPITILVDEGVLSQEGADRLAAAWIDNTDELYSRIKSCEFAGDETMRAAMEIELGIKPGTLDGFRKYIEIHVSPESINAEKPKQYPLGAKIPDKRLIGIRG